MLSGCKGADSTLLALATTEFGCWGLKMRIFEIFKWSLPMLYNLHVICLSNSHKGWEVSCVENVGVKVSKSTTWDPVHLSWTRGTLTPVWGRSSGMGSGSRMRRCRGWPHWRSRRDSRQTWVTKTVTIPVISTKLTAGGWRWPAAAPVWPGAAPCWLESDECSLLQWWAPTADCFYFYEQTRVEDG